jgi:hypothetical protein
MNAFVHARRNDEERVILTRLVCTSLGLIAVLRSPIFFGQVNSPALNLSQGFGEAGKGEPIDLGFG